MARPQRPFFNDLLFERREKAMIDAVKREGKDLSLAYVYFHPLPTRLQYYKHVLETALKQYKSQLIIKALDIPIVIRGVEHTIIRSWDVRDFDEQFGGYENAMALCLFGWAYPEDNADFPSQQVEAQATARP